MSQFILDEQLAVNEVLGPLQKRLKIGRLVELRPGERILDDRIPEILLTQAKPSFVTLDADFWKADLCHPHYAILYFALPEDHQDQLPPFAKVVALSSISDPSQTNGPGRSRAEDLHSVLGVWFQPGPRNDMERTEQMSLGDPSTQLTVSFSDSVKLPSASTDCR